MTTALHKFQHGTWEPGFDIVGKTITLTGTENNISLGSIDESKVTPASNDADVLPREMTEEEFNEFQVTSGRFPCMEFTMRPPDSITAEQWSLLGKMTYASLWRSSLAVEVKKGDVGFYDKCQDAVMSGMTTCCTQYTRGSIAHFDRRTCRRTVVAESRETRGCFRVSHAEFWGHPLPSSISYLLPPNSLPNRSNNMQYNCRRKRMSCLCIHVYGGFRSSHTFFLYSLSTEKTTMVDEAGRKPRHIRYTLTYSTWLKTIQRYI